MFELENVGGDSMTVRDFDAMTVRDFDSMTVRDVDSTIVRNVGCSVIARNVGSATVRNDGDPATAAARERDSLRRRTIDDADRRICFERIVPSVSVYTEYYDCTRTDLCSKEWRESTVRDLRRHTTHSTRSGVVPPRANGAAPSSICHLHVAERNTSPIDQTSNE